MKKSKKKRPGRPVEDNPKVARLPVVQITPDRLEEYRAAADSEGMVFSAWVRRALDRQLLEP